IGSAAAPGPQKHLFSVDLGVQCVKAGGRICLRFGIQRSLQLSNTTLGCYTPLNLPALAASSVALELRSLCSSIVTRLFATMDLSVTPRGLLRILADLQLRLSPRPAGLPVLTRCSFAPIPSPIPRWHRILLALLASH